MRQAEAALDPVDVVAEETVQRFKSDATAFVGQDLFMFEGFLKVCGYQIPNRYLDYWERQSDWQIDRQGKTDVQRDRQADRELVERIKAHNVQKKK